MGRRTKLLALAVGVIVLGAQVASACPMCKDSIPGSDAAQAGSVPGGFNQSVYLLLGGLFTCIGMMVTTIVRAIRSTDSFNAGATGSQSSRGFEVRRELG